MSPVPMMFASTLLIACFQAARNCHCCDCNSPERVFVLELLNVISSPFCKPVRTDIVQTQLSMCVPILPLKFLMKSSSFIFLSALTLGLYMSVLRRMMAKAKMKMVSGFWNCRTSVGLHIQYL